jgi:hypothetical protein
MRSGKWNVTFSGAVANLRWDSQGDLNWNVATTTNWQNLGTSAADVFFDFDTVLFNDTPGLQPTVDIGDGVTVRPSQITVDSTNTAYFIGGLGRIAGGAWSHQTGSEHPEFGGSKQHLQRWSYG